MNNNPEVRRLVRGLTRRARETRTQARASQAGYRSVEISDGPVLHYDDSGLPRLAVGVDDQGNFTVQELNSNPPPQPTPPVLTAVIGGGVIISWDGTYETENTPSNYSHTEIHRSDTVDFEKDDTTQIGTFASPDGGTFYEPVPVGVEYFYALVTVNTAGVESEPSTETSIIGTIGGEAPNESPTPEVVGGIRRIYLDVIPNENTVGVVFQVHISLENDFVAVLDDPDTLVLEFQSTSASFETLPDGSPLDPLVTYYVSIIAYNDVDAAAPSPNVAVTLHQITGPDISVDAAWVGTMTVDRLRGGDLQAEAIVVGGGGVVAKGSAGEEVGIRPTGFQVKGPTALGNPTYVDFPTDGAKPNIISGVLRATTLEVDSDPVTGRAISMRGASEIAAGAELRIASQIQAPVGAPVVIAEYPETTIDPAISYDLGNRGGFWDAASSRWYFISSGNVCWMDASGNLIGSHDLDLSADTVKGVTLIGSTFYVLYYEIYRNVKYRLWINQYDSSWNLLSSTYTGLEVPLGYGSITNDGTNPVIGYWTMGAFFSDPTPFTLRTLNPTTLATISTITTDHVADDASETTVIGSMVRGSFDLGATRFVVSFDHYIKVFNTAGVEQTNETFPPATTFARSLVWDGARFRSLSGGVISDYSVTKWTTESSKWWVANSKYTSSGPYETGLSPYSSLTMIKRAWLQVTASYAGATGARVYVGRGAAAPATSAAWRQATLASPDTSVLLDTVTFSGTAATAKSPDFPVDLPAQIISTSGGSYWKGDDTAKFLQLNVDSSTDANRTAGNKPALRIGPPAGQHLRIDGNEILSMSDDDSIGTLFLNAHGPTAISGMIKSGTKASGTISANTDKVVSVVFATPYPAECDVPRVFCQPTGMGSLANLAVAVPSNITRSGFDITVRRASATDFDTDWVAISTTVS